MTGMARNDYGCLRMTGMTRDDYRRLGITSDD